MPLSRQRRKGGVDCVVMVGRIDPSNSDGGGWVRVREFVYVCVCACVRVCVCARTYMRACVRDVFAIYDNII